ncbi:unnamed protein product [Microthlaspi erraticum]|uniref:BZIP domain-containing protein n=1 Tax=Microthlaspi erraticum TaxID=1685480 RepID=A0A6D2IQC1_9BRAS|nr:unnamed protein product [Microthlaspi erraticum]
MHGKMKKSSRQENKRKPSPDEQRRDEKYNDDKSYCRFHRRYGHTTETCRHVMSLIQEYSNTPQSQDDAERRDQNRQAANQRRRRDEDDDAEKNAPQPLPNPDDLPPPPKRHVR